MNGVYASEGLITAMFPTALSRTTPDGRFSATDKLGWTMSPRSPPSRSRSAPHGELRKGNEIRMEVVGLAYDRAGDGSMGEPGIVPPP
jgi:hypothetical protein